MNQDEYFSSRVDPDIKWYEKKAKLYRVMHILSRVLVVMISAIITVLSSISLNNKDFFIAVLSSLVIVITSISELMKFKDQWFDYRITVENIKSEKALFTTSTEPYDKDKNFNLFVKNYEMIVKSENQKWSSYISSK